MVVAVPYSGLRLYDLDTGLMEAGANVSQNQKQVTICRGSHFVARLPSGNKVQNTLEDNHVLF